MLAQISALCNTLKNGLNVQVRGPLTIGYLTQSKPHHEVFEDR